jgi:hypothetical protein
MRKLMPVFQRDLVAVRVVLFGCELASWVESSANSGVIFELLVVGF